MLLLGTWLRDRVQLLDRLNLPTPVIGGLIAAVLILALPDNGPTAITLDTSFQKPLMIAFFTCIGFTASFKVLVRGGPAVGLLLGLAAGVAVLQALLGSGIALAFGLNPLLGPLMGTATLAGGPATGLAFAPQFEAAGIAGAATIATATAMSGIVIASVLGAPLVTWIVERRGLDPRLSFENDFDAGDNPISQSEPAGSSAIKMLALIGVAMALGGVVSQAIQATGITLPAYIGAMLVAALIRNLDDATGILRLPHRMLESAGSVALALFLVLAMMGLNLSLIGGLALPLLVNLLAQTALIVALVVGPVWWLLGRDYDAAVASGGFAGFMLGTTANAMAVLKAITEKYGPAPRAFLTVPLVGAFFIDFTNALILTFTLNL
jgi:glutamate:Na+ symporter, ESS family